MSTKSFTLVVCPYCLTVLGIEKDKDTFTCYACRTMDIPIEECHKLGLKETEKGEWIWVGVKED